LVNVIFFDFTPLKYTLSITCATYLLSFFDENRSI